MPHSQLRAHQQRSTLLGIIFSPFIWLHALTVQPIVNFWLYTVLGAVEESISSLIREGLALVQRSVNGISAWVLSVSNRDYKQQLRDRWQDLADKHSWWRDEPNRKSTLNAVLARSYAGQGATSATGATAQHTNSKPSKVGSSSRRKSRTDAAPAADSSRPLRDDDRFPAGEVATVADKPPSMLAQQSTVNSGTAAAAVSDAHTQIKKCEIEPASDNSEADTAAQEHANDDAAESEDSSNNQWWPANTPAWLTAVSEEAQERAAAAQEAAAQAAAQASAAVQQAASSVSSAVEEAAAAAAALARNMRAVFEPQVGWGANEAIRRTGLLEDVSLFSQLLVNRIFDAIRWLVSSLTLVRTANTPRAAQAASSWLSAPPAATAPSSTRRGHAPQKAAAVGAGVAVAGVAAAKASRGAKVAAAGSVTSGLWAAIKQFVWPWGAAAAAGAVTAGAAAAAAKDLWEESHKHDVTAAAAAPVGVAPAPAVLYRRSATSIDLVRTVNPWQSDSEAEDDSDTEPDTAALPSTDSEQLSISYSGGHQRLPTHSSLRSSHPGSDRNRAAAVLTGLGNRVAFAAPDESILSVDHAEGSSPSAGAVAESAVDSGSISRGPSPFATANVQEKHHRVMSRHEWKQQQAEKEPQQLHEKHHGLRRRHKGHQHRHHQQQQGLQPWSSDSSASSASAGRTPMYRTHSGPALSELKDVSSAGQVIRMAGYPLEVHQVVTQDGYLLTMERIPQPKSTDVAFFMHGVLDTSLTWVAGGVTGSQAFAAWDRGFDIWLGSSRSNPPHAAVDPKRKGSSYWLYTHNECGVYDMGVQIDHIHSTKVRELAAFGISGDAVKVSKATPAAATAAQEDESEPQFRGGSTQQQQEGSEAILQPAVARSGNVISQSAPPDLVRAESAEKATANSSNVSAAAAGTMLPANAGQAARRISLHHAMSAAEADAVAAAEAAAALSRHRAAVAAAGISTSKVPADNRHNSDSERFSWWPGISSITNFSGFNISAIAGADKPKRKEPKRRTSSIDLGEAAALAAAVADAASLPADVVKSKTEARAHSAAPHAPERSSSDSSNGSSGVCCHIQVPGQHDTLAVSVAVVGGKHKDERLPVDGFGQGAATAVLPVQQTQGLKKLSSSSSLRHVLSAPDVGALDTVVTAVATDSTQQQQETASTGSLAASQQNDQCTSSDGAHDQHLQDEQNISSINNRDAAITSSTANGPSDAVKSSPAAGATHPGSLTGDPYNLRVVAHSLGGFLMLIHCTQRAKEGRPHHVKRLILLSPAGYHVVIPRLFKPLVPTWKLIMYYMAWVWRQKAFPVHLPTFVARLLTFKVMIDTSKLPAVGDLVRAFAKLVLGGDRSAWDRAMLMPHYTAAGMPLLSSLQVMQFIQLYLSGRCQLYDYGSPEANMQVYGQKGPPVVSDSYELLRDVPVHLVAGLHDGVIPADNIQCHFESMKAAGVDVSYREFEYGHMDFTYSAKEELGYYINSLLMRT